MTLFVMDTPNPKRPCHDGVSSTIQNPNPLPIAPDSNQTDLDSTISSFLLLPNLPSTSIGNSFDRVLGQVLSSASGDDSVQDRLIDRTGKLALLLQESTKRFSRMRATLYNSNSWPIPHEITIKVFSMLDTKSLMQASACCTMFRKCSVDPLCYSHIDLRVSTKRIEDEVVCSMIHRAGKELRSLKLSGVKSSRKKGSVLTRTCLASLIRNHWFNGGLLRSIHLYNLTTTGTKTLCAMLLVCPNLSDLKIVNFDRKFILEEVLKTFTKNRNSMIERLLLHNNIHFTAAGASCLTVKAFVTSCPNLTSLTLVGFDLNEDTTRNIAEGFPKLNYMNLSRTPSISSQFLRDLGNICGESPRKTIILRDCPSLDKKEVMKILDSLINGDFRFIRHMDVSNELGYGSLINIIPKILQKKLNEKRSDVTVVAVRLKP